MSAAEGHRPESAAKEGQADPGLTGCSYADACCFQRCGKPGCAWIKRLGLDDMARHEIEQRYPSLP